jgi:hypothetical protein
MPTIIEQDGHRVAVPDSRDTGERVSWQQLARMAGMPSHGRDAAFGAKAWYRDQAQRAILAAFNRATSGEGL